MKILKLVLASVALFALSDLPYKYYDSIKIFMTIGLLVVAFDSYKKNELLLVISLLLAVIFQPFTHLRLSKDIWIEIDISTASILIAFVLFDIFVEWKQKRNLLKKEKGA